MSVSVAVRSAFAGLLIFAISAGGVLAASTTDKASAKLDGFTVVPPVMSRGKGTATFKIRATSISFSISYSNLDANAAAIHVHLAQAGVNGGVMFFLCGGGGKPACPAATSGTIAGTAVAADIVGPAAQDIGAGNFAKVTRAMRLGISYVSVHTSSFPAGEIRGQIALDP